MTDILQGVDITSQPIHVQTTTLSLAVGNCLMAWANVEHTMHELFVAQVVRQSRNKQRFVIARGIWSVIISFEARLRMTGAAVGGKNNRGHVLLLATRTRQSGAGWRGGVTIGID